MDEHYTAQDADKQMTVIGPDTHIKGEMHFDGTARILGTFEGRISAKGEVQIGHGAVCKASVEGSRVIIDGTVEGDVTAHEAAQLNADASVTGDIVAPRMIVAEGASFVGHCQVGPDAADRPRRRQPEPQIVEPMPQRSNGQATAQRTNGQATRNEHAHDMNNAPAEGSGRRVEAARQRLAEAQARLTNLEHSGRETAA